jgi:hypothetical protein
MRAIDRPLRFDIESLRVFIAVIEEGSIAAASGCTHLVASAVSKRIGDLESDAGTSLLYRHSRGVHATPFAVASTRCRCPRACWSIICSACSRRPASSARRS